MSVLSRRTLLTTAAGSLAWFMLPGFASRPAQAETPFQRLRATTRTLDINGRAATVSGLLNSAGGQGLILDPGQRFQVEVVIELAEETIIHWHGQIPPNAQDGVSNTNPMIFPKDLRRFDFETRPGTYWMHAHVPAQEIDMLAAPLIVRSAEDRLADRQEVVMMLHDFSFRPGREILGDFTEGAAIPHHEVRDGSRIETTPRRIVGLHSDDPMAGMAGMNHGATDDDRAGGTAGMTSRARFGAAHCATGILLLLGTAISGHAEETSRVSLTEITAPGGPGATAPSIFGLADGRLALIWTDPTAQGHAVRVSFGNALGWSAPATVVSSGDLFVNWADFPSVAVLPDGTIAAHWLEETDDMSFAYDVRIALSQDIGATWSEAITPHRDDTQSQHGFVTLLPVSDHSLAVIWLDGRAYGSTSAGAMQLRGTFLESDGTLSSDTALDLRACSCCQTSAAVAEDGTLLVAYRDRTAGEIRDISVVRRVEGSWTEPRRVHADGWEISGCPVNGPAIDAIGSDAVVAWFTAAANDPAIKVAFSRDTGARFDRPHRIDGGDAAGRVDTVLLDDGSAVVTWVEWTREGEKLQFCRVTSEDGCLSPQTVTVNTASGSINFPRMARSGTDVYISWGQPGASATFRIVVAKF